MRSKEKITISDIAAAAGVSKATVSRYLNGKTELMREETRDRIKSIIEMSNYQPSEIARNLKRQSSNLIGVIISDISSPFSSAVIIGISRYLEISGYTPLVVNCDDNIQNEKNSIISLMAKGVSGLIVNTTSYDNNNLINVACGGLPIVLCDRYVKNYNFDIVTSQHKQGMYALISHLKEQGYTRPVLFAQDFEGNYTRFIRKQSFLQAVEQIYGYTPVNDIYVIDSQSEHSAYDALTKLCSELKTADIPAIIGINSVTTVRAFKAIKKMGMLENFGLCGPEDWDWNNEMNWPTLLSPSITTIVVHAKEMGEKSAMLLLEKIKQPDLPAREIQLPCEISIRQSTTLSK